jgi:hypothetical protein
MKKQNCPICEHNPWSNQNRAWPKFYGKSQSSSIGNQGYRQSLSPALSPSSAGRSGWSSNYSTSLIGSGSKHADEVDTTTFGTMILDLDAGSEEVITLILAAGDRARNRATDSGGYICATRRQC